MLAVVHQRGAYEEHYFPHIVQLHAGSVQPSSRREAGKVLVRQRRSPSHRNHQQDHTRAPRQVQLTGSGMVSHLMINLV